MRLTKHKRTTMAAMNMTPMIDIVFLLIIFFMTVTQVSKMNTEQMILPPLEGTQDHKPSKLIINITDAGEIKVGGSVWTASQIQDMVLQEILRTGDPSRVTLELRADKQATTRVINDVLKKLQAAEIKKINLNVVRER